MDTESLTKLGEILNRGSVWKDVARKLGFDIHIDEWQTKSNPAKLMIKFSEAMRVPRDTLLDIFDQLDASEAMAFLKDFDNKIKLN